MNEMPRSIGLRNLMRGPLIKLGRANYTAAVRAPFMKRPRILIAGIEETNQRLSGVLNDCDVTIVETMAEAHAALAQPYDLVLIAVRFDESRMFDLLRYLKSDRTLSRTPVICYRSAQRALQATDLGRQGVELASRTLGASDFIDLVTDPDPRRGTQKFRDAVFRAIETRRNV